jgi:hypothetical protein
MKQLVLVGYLGLAVAACEGGPAGPSPPPSTPTPPPNAVVVDGTVELRRTTGEEGVSSFVLTAPFQATLVLVLTWEPGLGNALRLRVDGADVTEEECCDWEGCCSDGDATMAARVFVAQGQQVLVTVEVPGLTSSADVPFVLQAWLEDAEGW